MIEAVFFDLDDTLCDAKPAFAAASQAAFDAIRARYPHLANDRIMEEWQAMHVLLLDELTAGRLSMAEVRTLRFRRLLATLGASDNEFADKIDLLLGQTQLQLLQSFDDVAVLEDLRGLGLHVGIITNGAGDTHPDSQRSKASHLGLIDRVDSFFVSDEIGYRKPDPRAFLPALRAADCKPNEALYVGDSRENDVLGANRAGMRSVLLWRSNAAVPKTIGDTQPQFVVSSLRDVIALVRSCLRGCRD